ncbi:CD109 antigen [Genypterus blacodes]|uniref:CD109 antigen n=1 Tax=Genypterus blacodes TaxID=154954 RepID=UPI003F76D3F1
MSVPQMAPSRSPSVPLAGPALPGSPLVEMRRSGPVDGYLAAGAAGRLRKRLKLTVGEQTVQMEQLKVWVFLSLLVLTSAKKNNASLTHQPSYLLVTPKYFHPKVPISVLFTALRHSDVTVEIELKYNEDVLASTSAEVKKGLTESLIFEPVTLDNPNLKPDMEEPFTLMVSGRVGEKVVFSDKTELHLKHKVLFTFIQTDKAKYLPGQGVKIRAVTICPDGKPYTSPVDIIIKDPRGNRIRQWLALDSDLGVVSKEFQLSDNPPLGHWTICTSVKGVLTEKQFIVAFYVLPKFEVVIDVPSAIYRETLYGSVTVKHQYGKPVKGHMAIKFTHYVNGMAEHHKETKQIDGTADFMYEVPDYQYDEARPGDYEEHSEGAYEEKNIKIEVYVTEDQTGLTYNSTACVAVAKQALDLSFIDHDNTFIPSLNFTAKLKISTYNDMRLSLEDQGKTVVVSVMQENNNNRLWEPYQEMEFLVPADGVIPLNIWTTNETRAITIDVSVGDSMQSLWVYRNRRSHSNSFLQIQKLPCAQVGSPVTLSIETTFTANKFDFIVMSRGKIVAHGQTSQSSITLQTNEDWAPLACIVVYCVQPDGEIISDNLRLPMKNILRNNVSLSWSEPMAKPGEMLSLMVSVEKAGSLVGILAVDKATLSKHSSNDIDEDMMLKEMLNYGNLMEDMMGNKNSIFKACCLVVLTDAKLPMTDTYSEIVHYAEDGSPEAEPHVRKNFPETWLWMDYHTGNSTTAELTVVAPDSLTTWVATAFVMSEKLGLGIVKMPAELTVFQDVFLSLNLPAFIIRGEELVMQIVMYNYLPYGLEVMLIIAESDTFEFVFPDNEDLSMASARELFVESQSSASVLIPIRPLILGEIHLSVKAISSAATDTVIGTVLVKPEGLEQIFSQTKLLEISTSGSSISRQMSFTFPADVVEGSKRVEVTVVGDILGSSIKGLNSLIRMPFGCGEQNMIHFAPNIYILMYLRATGQADRETTEKATAYMISGYERELSYQREDGSFSAFGDSDSSGSTWLSAFVLRCFLQARSFIPIDDSVLSKVGDWLVQQQEVGGNAMEPGRVIHTELQGGLDTPVSLTAYMLMALLEDDDIRIRYNSEVSAAVGFLETKLALGIDSSYSLSLLTYALALAGSSSANSALTELMGRAQMTDGVPMWTSSDAGLSQSWQPRSADIEMVSYVLLSMYKLQIMAQGLGLLKWLSQQRSHLGGFGSTQDTIVALQALSIYASHGGSQDLDLVITVNTDPTNTVATFYIDENNYLLYQMEEIEPEDEITLSINAVGKGFALFQMNVFYNIESGGLQRRKRDAHMDEAFVLEITVYDDGMNSADLFICTRLEEGLGLNATGMVVMEVYLLSGFSLAAQGLQTNDVLKKVECEPGKVILYLDSVTTGNVCFDIPMVLEYLVANVQDGICVIYDYYEPRRRTEMTYTSETRKQMSPCAFCGEDCQGCKAGEKPMASGATQTSSCPLLGLSLFLLLLRLLI